MYKVYAVGYVGYVGSVGCFMFEHQEMGFCMM